MEENEDYHKMDSEIDFETCSEEQSQGENFRTKYIIPTAENVEEFKRWLKVEKKNQNIKPGGVCEKYRVGLKTSG